ncbi:MAG: hypothetical protein WKG07_18320 [Hymenobacter sp.]
MEFKIPEGRTENAIDKALRDGSRQAQPHSSNFSPTSIATF